MHLDQFMRSLSDTNPPAGLNPYLLALWWDGKNNWEQAHDLIQHIDDKTASWIHAYLHRKEGDIFNADYWYQKAGRKRPAVSLEEEWKDIVREM